MQMFPNVKGLKTRTGAVERVIKFETRYGADLDYLIMHTDDNKFMPVVRLHDEFRYLMRAACDAGLCVI